MDMMSCVLNFGLIEMVCDVFVVKGIVLMIMYDLCDGWVNLFVIVFVYDGLMNGGIVLLGYIDVVLVDGQQWDSNLFVLEICDGCLYGCGICDMKGFIGVVFVLLFEMQVMKFVKLIYFVLFYDEEIGCVGVLLMIVDFVKCGV